MKKIYLYTTLLAAAMSFAACTEDYTDWADPQTNAQEAEQGAVNGTIAAATSAIDLNQAENGVAVVNFVSANNATEGSVVKFTKLLLNDQVEVPFTTDGNSLVVSAADLSDAIQSIYGSLATTTRDCNFKVYADLLNAQQTAVIMPIETNEVAIPVKTLALPYIASESAFYYVGGYNGWNLGSPTPMEANGDGTYSCIIELAAGSEWFCFAPQSSVDSQNWGALFRANSNGDDATSGFFNTDITSGNSFCANIESAGKYKFTIDPTNWTYSYGPYTESIYIAGDANGWGFSPLAKSGNNFIGYYYVKYADNSNTWGFKFTTDPSWNNPQYGAGETAGSIALGGGNIQLAPKDAFYQVVVNTDALTCTLNEITSITCVGNHNGWNVSDASQHMTYNVADQCWEITTELTNGFKFAMNDDWSISWGGANGDPTAYDNLTEFSGKDLNAPDGDGTYLVKLYLGCEGTHKVVLTKK